MLSFFSHYGTAPDSGWKIGLGAFYSQLTGKDRILPLVQAILVTEKLTVNLFGATFSFLYRLHPVLSAGVFARLDGDEYHLLKTRGDLYDADGLLVKEGVDVVTSYSLFTAGPSVQAVVSNFSLRLEGGLSAFRVFQIKAPREGETLRFGPDAPETLQGRKMDFDLKNKPYVKVVLKYGVNYTLK